jgi:hypothetical protein
MFDQRFRFIMLAKLWKVINILSSWHIRGDQKVSFHLMITVQKVPSKVRSVPRQSPDIYGHEELCSGRLYLV